MATAQPLDIAGRDTVSLPDKEVQENPAGKHDESLHEDREGGEDAIYDAKVERVYRHASSP